jgi:hypothetical protein
MKGKTVEEINAERARIVQMITERGDIAVNSVVNPPPDSNNFALWCLGRSLEILSECDEAFFMRGWHEARGCRIENSACIAYGIPVVLEQEDDLLC